MIQTVSDTRQTLFARGHKLATAVPRELYGGSVVKGIPKAIYQSANEIEMRIGELEFEAMKLRADTDQHRMIMQDIAKLRIYADAKRWLAGSKAYEA
jgi:hypothetical protein